MKDEHKQGLFLDAYDSQVNAIFRLCYFKTGDRELAKDLVQQVFMKFWSQLKDGERIEQPRAWLYRSANNLIIDWYRRKKAVSLESLGTTTPFDPPAAGPDPEQQAEVRQILDSLTALDDREREVITLRYVEGLGVKEIAALLGQPENNVSVAIYRGLKKLRKLLHINEHE